MTPHIGYTLSSEEHPPAALVEHARLAEEVGFDFVSISDHYHPWVDRQGHSPFVWSVIGGIATTTSRIGLGTGVTCPTIRIHPAIIAQAAATSACLMPDRFVFGVGTGEALNEHILGDRWPEYEVRVEQLAEAIEVIRALWTGKVTSHHGPHYTVENARIYDVPDRLPAIVVSAGGERSAKLAAEMGDGLWLSSVQPETIQAYRAAGGTGPVYAQVQVCWGASEEQAARTAFEAWPTAGLRGQVSQELPSPQHFGELVATVTQQDIADAIPHGPDPSVVVDALRHAIDAGATHAYVHQVGPRQDEFLRMAAHDVLPRIRSEEQHHG